MSAGNAEQEMNLIWPNMISLTVVLVINSRNFFPISHGKKLNCFNSGSVYINFMCLLFRVINMCNVEKEKENSKFSNFIEKK